MYDIWREIKLAVSRRGWSEILVKVFVRRVYHDISTIYLFDITTGTGLYELLRILYDQVRVCTIWYDTTYEAATLVR